MLSATRAWHGRRALAGRECRGHVCRSRCWRRSPAAEEPEAFLPVHSYLLAAEGDPRSSRTSGSRILRRAGHRFAFLAFPLKLSWQHWASRSAGRPSPSDDSSDARIKATAGAHNARLEEVEIRLADGLTDVDLRWNNLRHSPTTRIHVRIVKGGTRWRSDSAALGGVLSHSFPSVSSCLAVTGGIGSSATDQWPMARSPVRTAFMTVGIAKAKSGVASFFDIAGTRGTKIAIDQINAAGGIKGCKIRTIEGDTKSDPAVAAQVARSLLDHGAQILLVPDDFDLGSPPLGSARRRACSRCRSAASSTEFAKAVGDKFFNAGPTTTQLATAQATFALGKGWKSATWFSTRASRTSPSRTPSSEGVSGRRRQDGRDGQGRLAEREVRLQLDGLEDREPQSRSRP